MRGTSPVLEQPPYSAGFALCDFFLFPKLKGIVKETCFEGVKALIMEVRSAPEESFQQSTEVWQRRMEKCIRHEEDYFEGETI